MTANRIVPFGSRSKSARRDLMYQEPGYTNRAADVPIAEGRVAVEWPEHPGMKADAWGPSYGRHTTYSGDDT